MQVGAHQASHGGPAVAVSHQLAAAAAAHAAVINAAVQARLQPPPPSVNVQTPRLQSPVSGVVMSTASAAVGRSTSPSSHWHQPPAAASAIPAGWSICANIGERSARHVVLCRPPTRHHIFCCSLTYISVVTLSIIAHAIYTVDYFMRTPPLTYSRTLHVHRVNLYSRLYFGFTQLHVRYSRNLTNWHMRL